ncbi:MAG: MFS transporter [Candidatus Velamenicoccus archaeovorus]
MDPREPLSSQGGSAQRWTTLLVLYGITSVVETFGVSQIFAFMPLYLRRLGTRPEDVAHWVGLLASLTFVLGLPLVPLWGVWADKHSRKAVIIRSALVESLVLGLVAASRAPWQFAITMLLIGFQLGNTGVMLAGLRDVTPPGRLGTAMAVMSASGPLGLALGPLVGGWLLQGVGLSMRAMFGLDAVLSFGTAVMLGIGAREIRPAVVPRGRTRDLAFGAVRGVLTDAAVRRLFLIYGTVFMARQLVNPFLPILVERVHGSAGVEGAIGLVVGTAALVGAAASPAAGPIGDRVGFRPVLVVTLVVGAAAVMLMPVAPGTGVLAGLAAVYAAVFAVTAAMVFALLSIEVAPERRSATLNLVYVPLYVSGIVGPAIGAGLVTLGLAAPFLAAGGVLASGAGGVLAGARRRAEHPAS